MTKFKCSLLVVDDEPYILATLAALLSTEFEVLTADSGEAAKAVLEQRAVDIILSDQRMPQTNGVQLLGGHGFTKEHPVELWYRQLRAIGVLEGALLV